jgi:hypothetical protein
MSNILNKVIADLKLREEKGLKEYGTTVDRLDYDLKAWLTELYEELLDSAVYVKAAIDKMENNDAAH